MLSGLISLRNKAEKERQPLAWRRDRSRAAGTAGKQLWDTGRDTAPAEPGASQSCCSLCLGGKRVPDEPAPDPQQWVCCQAAGLSSTQLRAPTAQLESLLVVFLLSLFNLFQYCVRRGPQYKLKYFNIIVLNTNGLPTGFIPK